MYTIQKCVYRNTDSMEIEKCAIFQFQFCVAEVKKEPKPANCLEGDGGKRARFWLPDRRKVKKCRQELVLGKSYKTSTKFNETNRRDRILCQYWIKINHNKYTEGNMWNLSFRNRFFE